MTTPLRRVPDSPWGKLFFDGVRVPGIASIGWSDGRSLQENKSKSENGNTIGDNGYDGMQVDGTIQVRSEPGADEYSEFMALYPNWRVSGDGLRVVTIEHPLCGDAQLSRIIIKGWKIPPPRGDMVTISFSAVKWFPAPKPVKTGGGGGTSSGWSVGEAVDDAGAFISDAAEAIWDGLAGGQSESQTGGEPNYDVPPPDPVHKGSQQP